MQCLYYVCLALQRRHRADLIWQGKEDFWDTKEFVVSPDPCIILQEMWTSQRCSVNMQPGWWKTYLLGGDSISGLISCLHICLCLTAAHKRGRPGVKSWRIELPRTRGVWSDMFQTPIHHSLSVTHFVVPYSLSFSSFLYLNVSVSLHLSFSQFTSWFDRHISFVLNSVLLCSLFFLIFCIQHIFHWFSLIILSLSSSWCHALSITVYVQGTTILSLSVFFVSPYIHTQNNTAAGDESSSPSHPPALRPSVASWKESTE